MSKSTLEQFDAWLDDDYIAAVVLRQPLRPVEGIDVPLFPPTYAKPEGVKEEDWTGYNIDYIGLPDNNGVIPPVPNVCLVDSIGSQANRIEPAFKTLAGGKLVPQVVIDVEGDPIHLLDAGHRVADAVVRFSDLINDITEAILAYRDGNAKKLATLAPTSLVFGAWDSRETQVKIPRLFAATIRAFDVQTLTRSAQYTPPKDYIRDDVIDDHDDVKATRKRYSQEGVLDAPATYTHGGVIAREIRRDATLNLATLRMLAVGDDRDATRSLQRYVLGLALVALTYLDGKTLTLRQGCQLVANGQAKCEVVRADGSDEAFSLSSDDAVTFAQAAAKAFGVGKDRAAVFDPKQAKRVLALSEKEADKARVGKAARRKKASS